MAKKDDRWRSCEGTWDRLKWARLQKFDTAEDAATFVGEKAGTYRAFERHPDSSKHTPLDPQRAFHFAKRFGVRWEWLLRGEGEPWMSKDEQLNRILLALTGESEDTKTTVADFVERMLKAG